MPIVNPRTFRCSKCGVSNVQIKFLRYNLGRSCTVYKGDLHDGGHFHCKCNRCGYMWSELDYDNKDYKTSEMDVEEGTDAEYLTQLAEFDRQRERVYVDGERLEKIANKLIATRDRTLWTLGRLQEFIRNNDAAADSLHSAARELEKLLAELKE